MAKESRADRELPAVLRPFAKVEPCAITLIGKLKAEYFEWVNVIGVLLQLFTVARIGDELDVRAALFFCVAIP